jgi:hypothetical protein
MYAAASRYRGRSPASPSAASVATPKATAITDPATIDTRPGSRVTSAPIKSAAYGSIVIEVRGVKRPSPENAPYVIRPAGTVAAARTSGAARAPGSVLPKRHAIATVATATPNATVAAMPGRRSRETKGPPGSTCASTRSRSSGAALNGP